MGERVTELDRKAFAISLREAGLVGVDFEDWDGLTDTETIGLIGYMNNIRIDPAAAEEYAHEV